MKNPFRKRITLPLFINRGNKYPAGVILLIIAASLYLSSNHIHIRQPGFLPMHWLDHMIPFLPWTIWVYLSEYILFVYVYYLCDDVLVAQKYFYSLLFAQCVSVVIFWIWPTVYPRELFPLPSGMDAVTYFVFDSLRQTDTAANCFPSIHVSCVCISVLILLDGQRKFFFFFSLWGVFIALSTLTAKQHYFADIAAGLILAFISRWIFSGCVNYRTVVRDD